MLDSAFTARSPALPSPVPTGRGALVLAATAALLTGLWPVAGAGQTQDMSESMGPSHDMHGAPSPLPVGRIAVQHDPEGGRITVALGPFDLPASGNTMRLTPAEALVIPVDGWLTAFRARILDDAGRPLPDEILHHINLVRPDRRELFMPVMQRLVAASHETGRVDVPFPFGVAVESGDTVLVVAMLHNPTGREARVTVEAVLDYDGPEWLDRWGVQPFYVDVSAPPDGAAFDVPPGRSEVSWEGSPAIDVKILALGGHAHRFARELRLVEVRDDGSTRVLWRAEPRTGPDGGIDEIPRRRFLHRLGLPLSRDRTYRLVGVYDNPTGAVLPAGGMAEIAGVVWPSEAWPGSADRGRVRADCLWFTRHNLALMNRVCG
jgi:hypothetical protein